MPGTSAVASKTALATGVSQSKSGPLLSGPGVLAMADWRLLFGVDSYSSDWGAGRLTLLSRVRLLRPTARTPKRRIIALAVLFARALRSASIVLRAAITA